ncbi:helix-turn-helix domain-containing protein [Streptomyces sp. BH097]|uniref:helix-turn-helix domain-containing protein n=1 Tax=unclassified Streptomyces TaxID=2593676 RepID=UPI003BB7F2A2
MDRDDWALLGATLKRDRRRQGLTQQEAADALDAGLSSIQAIERGHEYSKPTRTIRQYAALLHWTDGSVEQVLGGGERTLIHAEAPDSTPADADLEDRRLPLRIVHELSDDGELLDTAVIKIGEKGRAVIVVKGEPGVAAEELLEELRAWNRKRASLEEGDATEPPAAAEGS